MHRLTFIGKNSAAMVQWAREALHRRLKGAIFLSGVPSVGLAVRCKLIDGKGLVLLNAENIPDIPALNKAEQPYAVCFANEAQRHRAEEMGEAYPGPLLVVGEDPAAFVEQVAMIVEQRGHSN